MTFMWILAVIRYSHVLLFVMFSVYCTWVLPISNLLLLLLLLLLLTKSKVTDHNIKMYRRECIGPVILILETRWEWLFNITPCIIIIIIIIVNVFNEDHLCLSGGFERENTALIRFLSNLVLEGLHRKLWAIRRILWMKDLIFCAQQIGHYCVQHKHFQYIIVILCSGLSWLRIRTGGWLLWVRLWTFGFLKIWGISWLAEVLLASREGLRSIEIFR
jgi:hypothetical protein